MSVSSHSPKIVPALSTSGSPSRKGARKRKRQKVEYNGNRDGDNTDDDVEGERFSSFQEQSRKSALLDGQKGEHLASGTSVLGSAKVKENGIAPSTSPDRGHHHHHDGIQRRKENHSDESRQSGQRLSSPRSSKSPTLESQSQLQIPKRQERQKQTSFQQQRAQQSSSTSNLNQKFSPHPSLKLKAQKLLPIRKALPIWSHESEIRSALRQHDVLLLVGETGSGKSTQMPHILLEEDWCRRRNVLVPTAVASIAHSNLVDNEAIENGIAGGGRHHPSPVLASEMQETRTRTTKAVGGCIAITQPRRIAAISLARRVAEEMASPLGNNTSKHNASSSVGSRSGAVGYSVRFEHNAGPHTRVKFLTEGMLIKEMQRDPWLTDYSVVVVDEVHERGVNADLVLGFLRRLLDDDANYDLEEGEKSVNGSQGGGEDEGRRKRGTSLAGRGNVPLKIVVMSATAEMRRLRDYFDVLPSNKMNGYSGADEEKAERLMDNSISTLGAATQQGKDSLEVHSASAVPNGDAEEEWRGFSSSENDDEDHVNGKHQQSEQEKRRDPVCAKAPVNGIKINGDAHVHGHEDDHHPVPQQRLPRPRPSLASRVATCHIEGRQYPVQVKYTSEPVQDFVDAALHTIFQIHHKEPLPGDILVFVTGQETVESLEALVKDYAMALSPDLPKILVLPFFAALPQPAQQLVFEPTPPKSRKVIIATNVAETSVTVSGVRFVIDCGKAKIKQFRSRIGLESLLVKPISKSAAIQRKGRAGREAPGQCYRLYTEQDYLGLQDSNTPEILRCDLSQALLTMKAKGVENVSNFPFLDQPSKGTLHKALVQLSQLGALKDSGAISEVGLRMSKFPLPVSLGRSLIAATTESGIDCVSELIDIVSCLSVENIFLNITSEEKKEEAETARRDLTRREGDHLTLLATIQAYAYERADRKAWANRHFVSYRAMKSAMDVRKQLRILCQQMGLLKAIPESEMANGVPPPPSSERATSILKALLKGFALNTARLCPDSSYRTIVGNQTVAIHPASGLFGKKVEAIMYNEFVFTNRSYARGVSAVQMDWIAEAIGA